MNTKRKGSHNEHRSMALLEARGYRCTRSAASLGAWDIVGIGIDHVVLVQVKTGRMPSRAEYARLVAFRVPDNCVKMLHIWWPREQTPEEVEII